MTPRFARTRRFANVYAMFAVDVLFVFIWLSAFATQASYNSNNMCGKVCHLSKAIVGLGVFITYDSLHPTNSTFNTNSHHRLLFVLSSLVSAYTSQYYKFHGNLPGYDNRKLRSGENIDPDKAAFSMAPHDDEAYERVNMDDHEAGGSGYGTGERYGHVNPYSADDYDEPTRYGSAPPRNTGMFDNDTEYTGAAAAGSNISYNSRTDAYDGHEPAQFPAGSYDRIER